MLELAQLVELELLQQQELLLELLVLQWLGLLVQQLHIHRRRKLKLYHSCCMLELLRIRHSLVLLRSCCSLELLLHIRHSLVLLHSCCSLELEHCRLEQLRSRLALACSTLP